MTSGGQKLGEDRRLTISRRENTLFSRTALACLVALCSFSLAGCVGLVSGSNTTTPPSALNIINVQVAAATTSTCQIVWTTNVPANSQVDYGATTAYGSSTPLDATMVTSHAVNISGLAAGTTYYFQVSSTDAKNNNGKGLGHFKTAGFSISGTITPAASGNGTTVTLSGGATAATNADASGNYSLTGLPNGVYTVTPSRTGYSFSPVSQTPTLNGANVSGVNFSASSSATAPAITTQPANQTVTAGQTASFTVVATGTAPLSYQWQKNGANIAGATAASYTTPATTTADSGSTFRVVVSNSAGNVTSAAATLTVNTASFNISGTVSPGSAGSGATLTLSGAASATTTANTSGAYTFTGLANGTYAVTPSRTGYTFSPTSQTATVSGANVTGVNFTATAQTFSLSGTINPTSGGAGATVTLGGAANAVTTANSSGAYTFTSLVNGSYTVTPTNTGYTFSPTSQNVTINSANVSGINFSAVAVVVHSATASWTASTSAVAGYNVYRGTVSGGPYTKVNGSLVTALSYTDSTVTSGQTYYYVTTAVDSSGNESVFSNEVQAVIP